MTIDTIDIDIKEKVLLSWFTTIKLGGNAKFFVSCKNENEIVPALKFSEERKIPVQVISGGSNIIFSDSGYEGLVIKIDIKGMEFAETKENVLAKVRAGESWDDFVKSCIEKELTGIECLSGIPGSAGATPVQNVGAYGQEIKESLISVKAIDRNTLDEITFMNEDCRFGYRQSRFKNSDKDRYIITELLFGFTKNTEPEIKYDELRNILYSKYKYGNADTIKEKLLKIRSSVLELRRGKSMVIDVNDANSRSCGSFFMNPVLSKDETERLSAFFSKSNEKLPVYKYGDMFKTSAAWLLEKAGFHKGYIKGGVGISQNHSLALININGSAGELLGLADEIEDRVFKMSGIKLDKEPVIVQG